MTEIIEGFKEQLPAIRGWVEDVVEQHRADAEAVGGFGFDEFEDYFSPTTLEQTRVVLVDRLPVPPLSSLGISGLTEFESGGEGYNAITLLDTYFVKRGSETDRSVHFHELIHVLQWEIMGIDRFLIEYGVGLYQKGYWDCPLEVMARRLTDLFNDQAKLPFDAEALVRSEIK